ncbi:flagellar M-ring protein FliF [Alkalibacterium subtropicum]|uniref:Flagellar M-ring protein n=1 Tax=Alkalibacterium subtropicum TaxID=753702 RepID=A0A1I1IV09_9LACT|nr:flagellar basal-body MS-ring/collar protein FliF [Alkalibacterium subtropicum]SFC40139.1 flagellar M-ring protein FliF [Alkalibacterium subtropicum]
MNKVKQVGLSIQNGWLQLDKTKRKRLITFVSIALIATLLIGYFMQRSTYTVLFSNLEEADAGAIVEDLESQGLAYRLEDNGTTILMDEEAIDNYRIDLAVNGLMPEKSTGFEIFDETSMMTTDEDRQIMYQRALTGELERSISSLQQVEAAKVMLSLPEDSIFQNPEYRTEASASIVIDSRGALSQQNIQGIASLVTGAVERLPVENVQIVDTSGNLLSGFLQSGGNSLTAAEMTTNHQSMKQSYEKELEQRILSLLAPVYGYNNLRVVVNADMNFDVVEGETIEYTAPMTEEGDENREGLIRSQTESFDGARDMVASLIEGQETPLADDDDPENNASLDRTTNYELNQETKRYVQAPGVVEGVNASIVVNANSGIVPAEPEIDRIVSRALGLDNEADVPLRGDVTVGILPFADGEELVIDGAPTDLLVDITDFLKANWIYMSLGLLLLVVSIFVLSLVKRGKPEEDFFEEEPVESAPVKVKPEKDYSEIMEKENEVKKQKNKVMSEKEDRVRKEAKENPELVADLMKVWLKD